MTDPTLDPRAALAAERERADAYQMEAEEANDAAADLSQRLAAERERREQAEAEVERLQSEAHELRARVSMDVHTAREQAITERNRAVEFGRAKNKAEARSERYRAALAEVVEAAAGAVARLTRIDGLLLQPDMSGNRQAEARSLAHESRGTFHGAITRARSLLTDPPESGTEGG